MEGLGTFAFFAFLTAIILVPRWFKNKERQELQATLRAAIERGQPLPPEVIDSITRDAPQPRARAARGRNDLRQGVVWLAVALGICGLGFGIGYESVEAYRVLLGIACIPGFIGLALIAMGLVDRFSGSKVDRELA